MKFDLDFRPASEVPTVEGDYVLYNQCDGYHVVEAWFDEGEFCGFYFFANPKAVSKDFYCAWAPLPKCNSLYDAFARTANMELAESVASLGGNAQDGAVHTYAHRLVMYVWGKYYQHASPNFKPLDDTYGLLSQLDNMLAGLTQDEQKPEEELMMLRAARYDEAHGITATLRNDRIEELEALLGVAALAPSEPKVTFMDKWRCVHTLTLRAAADELKALYDEWPGGLEEIESALRTARNQKKEHAK